MKLWSLFGLLLLAGCWASASGTLQISEPYVEVSSPLKNGVASLRGVSVAVVPINYRRLEERVGPLFAPVVPVGGDVTFEGQGKAFRVVVELDTSSVEISFDPAMLELELAGKTYRPERVGRPYIGTYGIRTAWYRSIPGHSAWGCDYRNLAPLSSEPRSVTPIGKRGCFAVEFPVVTPDVSQPFSVRVGGLARNGAPMDVLTFRFRASTATYTYRAM
jgi:hypothetical protein